MNKKKKMQCNTGLITARQAGGARKRLGFGPTRWSVQLVSLLLALAVTSCTNDSNSSQKTEVPQQTKRVVVVSYALQYLTSRIVGDEIEVVFPASESSDPSNWSPAVDDISSMQRADLIIVNGSSAPFAQWLVQVTLPASKICESCDDIPLSKLIAVADYQIVHSHGPEGEHSHAYMVPHAWLDPELAALQAKKIAECLSKTYGEFGETIKDNLASLLQDLENIKKPGQSVTNEQNVALVTTSPEMKFITRFAGFDDNHVLWFDELFTENSVDALKLIENKIGESSAAAVICGSVPEQKLVELCQENNCPLIQLDLLELKPASGDYLSQLQANLNRLAELQPTTSD